MLKKEIPSVENYFQLEKLRRIHLLKTGQNGLFMLQSPDQTLCKCASETHSSVIPVFKTLYQ